ncbi:MAG: hypothetical protein ACE5KF_11945 [Kiloniellaceae bacterium]
MVTHLERVIRLALADARAAGLDYPGQTYQAVRELLQTRPDLTDSEAQEAVDRVRWEVPV